MTTESQLKSEFYCGNFRSVYSSASIAKGRDDEFYGGEKEFEKLIEDMTSESYRYSFACFGKFQEKLLQHHLKKEYDNTNRCTLKEDVELYIIINTDKNKLSKYAQYCWMDVEKLIEHINTVKSLFEGFEFSVMKDEERNFMKVKFLFKKGEISYFKIRFLLTWMRYSYEWAISMSTLDAYRLPNYIPELVNENIFNLIQITNKFTEPNILHDQVICVRGCPVAFDKFKEAVNKESNNSLNDDTYPICNMNLLSLPDIRAQKTSEGQLERKYYYSLAWWLDEESFVEQRLPYYKDYLKTLKDIYKYEPAK